MQLVPDTTLAIRFQATLLRPGGADKGADWTFLNLPQDASDQLPSRGLVSVQGTLDGTPFQATLQPDGQGGHWLKVPAELSAKTGEIVVLAIAPMAEEPEPEVPEDLRLALEAADTRTREVWAKITPLARRDWIHWIVSPKKAETRAKRIASACDMLAKGKRRPCCFDRSGMYDNSLCAPEAE